MKHFYRTIRLRHSPIASIAAAVILLAAIGSISFADPPSLDAAAQPAGTVYLTFDDGPSAVTEEILEVLEDEGVRATFFVIGSCAERDPEMLEEIWEDGHAIGLHTYSHEYSEIYSSEEAFWREMALCADIIERDLGFSPTLLRFPGGSGNTVFRSKGCGGDLMARVTEGCADMGYSYHDWNVDTGDNLGKTLSAETIAERIVEGCRGKQSPVVLMHDSANAKTGPAALKIAIPQLRAMGYSFATLESLESPVHQTLAG